MFQTFGNIHIFVLLICLVLSGILYFLRNRFFNQLRFFIAFGLIFHQIIFYIYHFYNQTFLIQKNLPLHLCSFSLFLVALALLTKNPKLIKTAIFWSPVSVFLAVLLPDLTSPVFSFNFFEFFFSHIFIIFGSILIYTSKDLRLNLGFYDILKSIGLLLLLSFGLIYPINIFLESNYMYLIDAPTISGAKVFPDFPFHIFYLFIILTMVFSVEFLIYKFFDVPD